MALGCNNKYSSRTRFSREFQRAATEQKLGPSVLQKRVSWLYAYLFRPSCIERSRLRLVFRGYGEMSMVWYCGEKTKLIVWTSTIFIEHCELHTFRKDQSTCLLLAWGGIITHHRKVFYFNEMSSLPPKPVVTTTSSQDFIPWEDTRGRHVPTCKIIGELFNIFHITCLPQEKLRIIPTAVKALTGTRGRHQRKPRMNC